MSDEEPTAQVPGVSIDGSQGVQVGSGNVQYNTWRQKSPLDPIAIRDLNPHTAVARLQKLTHDELVDFFARASPSDVGEVLDVLFDVDAARLTVVLADVSRRKANELIEATHLDRRIFALLPEASEVIARKAARLRWAGAGQMRIWWDGYDRSYDNGHISWSKEYGTRITVGTIDKYYSASSSECGFAVGDQEIALSSPFETEGIRQKFRNGTVYSSKFGTFLVVVGECYESEGGSGDWLGFPISERYRNERYWQCQLFESGTIYSYNKDERSIRSKLTSFAVRQDVVKALPFNVKWWRPISKETAIESSSGTRGTVQHFECRTWARRAGTSVHYEAAAYSSTGHETLILTEKVWRYYKELGAENSWLGFPITTLPSVHRGVQLFENGAIYYGASTDPITIHNKVLALTKKDTDPLGRIDYPLTQEQPAGLDGSGRIQFFRNGIVTIRDGEYEIWIRPLNRTISLFNTALNKAGTDQWEQMRWNRSL